MPLLLCLSLAASLVCEPRAQAILLKACEGIPSGESVSKIARQERQTRRQERIPARGCSCTLAPRVSVQVKQKGKKKRMTGRIGVLESLDAHTLTLTFAVII